jgi:hypothetical protein
MNERMMQTLYDIPVVRTRAGSVADGFWSAPPPENDVEYCHQVQPPAVLHTAKDNQLVGIGKESASLPAAPARYLTQHCVTKGGGGGVNANHTKGCKQC